MSDWKDNLSPLKWLDAILRLAGKLVPKEDRYKANLLFDLISIVLCFAIVSRVQSVSNDRVSVLLMFFFVVAISGVCIVTSFILTRSR